MNLGFSIDQSPSPAYEHLGGFLIEVAQGVEYQLLDCKLHIWDGNEETESFFRLEIQESVESFPFFGNGIEMTTETKFADLLPNYPGKEIIVGTNDNALYVIYEELNGEYDKIDYENLNGSPGASVVDFIVGDPDLDGDIEIIAIFSSPSSVVLFDADLPGGQAIIFHENLTTGHSGDFIADYKKISLGNVNGETFTIGSSPNQIDLLQDIIVGSSVNNFV